MMPNNTAGTLKKWNLKAQSEKKFALGHPWVFSNDLGHSPKGITPGDLIELYDHSGRFLARGYGNPNTLIAFRVLSRFEEAEVGTDLFLQAFEKAFAKRELANLLSASYRLIFAEADGLPGLIVDRFLLKGAQAQAFVLQFSTAGMDRLREPVIEALRLLVEKNFSVGWQQTAVILANDSKSRLIEGLKQEDKAVHKNIEGIDWTDLQIEIAAAVQGAQNIAMAVDLIGGQKTGFFLDQRSNIHMFVKALMQKPKWSHQSLQVLDLCCYNGQWSSQVAQALKQLGLKAEFTCVDASEKALALAKRSVTGVGISPEQVRPLKLDVLKDLSRIADASFDIVICDPPAFIKKKADIPNGERAYMKLNRDAIAKLRQGGLFISCSCSGLLDESAFRSMLVRAAGRTTLGGRMRWLWRGAQSPDHPELPEFPQGTYLKSWMGVME